MAVCNIPTLMSNASTIASMLTPGQRPVLRLALLSAILQISVPSFTPNESTINTLLASAACFNCLGAGQKKVLKAQLLCEILKQT